MLPWAENEMQHMEESTSLDYWKQINIKTAEYEGLAAQGAWLEADLLDEAAD